MVEALPPFIIAGRVILNQLPLKGSYHPTVRFGLNTSDSEIIIRGSIRLVTRSPQPQNRARADSITRNPSTSFPSTCIRALCASATAASLSPILPLQTHVFHTRRLFTSLSRGFLRAGAKVGSLAH